MRYARLNGEEYNWDEDTSPDDWMYSLKNFLWTLGDYFQDEQDVVDAIEEQLSMIDSWVDEHIGIHNEREERLIGRVDVPIVPQSTRSIFDDVDEN